MRDTKGNILVYLPSPMGDGILCTPALGAIRRHFKSSQISFFANPVIREILSPNNFNDSWLDQEQSNPLATALLLKSKKFTHAILFKNSFASALAIFLAGIPSRIGYAREGRGFLLTDKLYPPRLPSGKFKPRSMIDYYLQIASHLGADTGNRTLELLTEPKCLEKLKAKLPEIFDLHRPIVILVPGGAFGLSKCWLSERFAQTADRLIANYNAAVVISVSPASAECQIAEDICRASKNKLINLARIPLSLGELKSLFSVAELVITNDTGPRHIAIALKRKLITLFGPNDPAWTETGYENEIKITGKAHCVPCSKPECKEFEHLCMQSITVDMVCEASEKLLASNL
jgi:heptosyltransferase-2